MRMQKMVAFLSCTFLAIGAATALANPAFADSTHPAALDGWCDDGEACLYYNSNLAGGIYDVNYSVASYEIPGPPAVFKVSYAGRGDIHAGVGQHVWNNAASVYNRSRCWLRVYYYSNFIGAEPYVQEFAPGQWANLNPTLKNNNASQRFMC